MPKKKGIPRDGILVLVDFSEASAAALDFASEQAARWECPLVVLHVVHEPGDAPGYYAKVKRKKFFRRMEDVGRAMLDEFLTEARARRPDDRALEAARGVTLRGLPVTKSLQLAKHIEARQIVVGNRGHSGLRRLMLGSKAEQVVRLSPVPVTVVRAPEKAKDEPKKADKARKDKAGKDKAGKDKAGKEKAGKEKAGKEKAGKEKAGKDEAGKDEAGKDEAGKDRAGKAEAGKKRAAKNEAAKADEAATHEPATAAEPGKASEPEEAGEADS